MSSEFLPTWKVDSLKKHLDVGSTTTNSVYIMNGVANWITYQGMQNAIAGKKDNTRTTDGRLGVSMQFPAIPPPNVLELSIKFRCESDGPFISASTTSRELNISVSSDFTTDCTRTECEKQKLKRWIHFVGVGRCGMSALAMLALKQGSEVSGSDTAWSRIMDGLQEAGARFAIPSDTVEILHAKAMGVPVIKRGVWLEMTTKDYNLITVSGTHGKSTTASMLAYVLNAMGDDLTAIVGAHVPQFPGGNILLGSSPNLVLEADEYDDCFLQLLPFIAVITNVEWEHVDIFKDEEAVKNSFRKFLKKIKVGGHLVLCGDSEGACSLLNHTSLGNVRSVWRPQPLDAGYRVTTYGIANRNEWRALSIRQNSRGGTDYALHHKGCLVANISLQLAGVHNDLNSLAVIATIRTLIDDRWPTQELINCMKLHLNNFIGVSRRLENIVNINNCHIFDDYAHHPTEVCAVLQAARQKFPLKALLVIFQPHTFSRLATFLKDFATAFRDADRVIITEVYSAREENIWNISGTDLASSIIGPPSEFIPFVVDVVDKLAREISSSPGQELFILTLGAGDVTNVGPSLLQKLQHILWGGSTTR
ncbi:Udp-n-acetylmuramate--l-alanine ligase [Thalictrum thalictroides]|uniref:Udp-n-acetylmuramate--l-alanine ligase n=1 Tax=Thalictrum thalictroides TaxID=46969 RepID=A0A7J6UT74_THATH|nr:Udp-n-acetylmuramate--l-alanine ligase [Thalictrum thalictroides]